MVLPPDMWSALLFNWLALILLMIIFVLLRLRQEETRLEVDARAVNKKMRDKGFARQVPRDQLEKGALELGVPFDEHVSNVVEGLKTVRGELGL